MNIAPIIARIMDYCHETGCIPEDLILSHLHVVKKRVEANALTPEQMITMKAVLAKYWPQ
jgi:hypothetical protein